MQKLLLAHTIELNVLTFFLFFSFSLFLYKSFTTQFCIYYHRHSPITPITVESVFFSSLVYLLLFICVFLSRSLIHIFRGALQSRVKTKKKKNERELLSCASPLIRTHTFRTELLFVNTRARDMASTVFHRG